MECKDEAICAGVDEIVDDLIEPLWNVKVSSSYALASSGIDLIETLWNVKLFFCIIKSNSICDLIETLWNVKGLPCSQMTLRMQI